MHSKPIYHLLKALRISQGKGECERTEAMLFTFIMLLGQAESRANQQDRVPNAKELTVQKQKINK